MSPITNLVGQVAEELIVLASVIVVVEQTSELDWGKLVEQGQSSYW